MATHKETLKEMLEYSEQKHGSDAPITKQLREHYAAVTSGLPQTSHQMFLMGGRSGTPQRLKKQGKKAGGGTSSLDRTLERHSNLEEKISKEFKVILEQARK